MGQVIPLICGLARLVGAVVLEQGLLIATQKEQMLWLPEEGRSSWTEAEISETFRTFRTAGFYTQKLSG